jgi:hypothetical protein
MFHYAQLVQHRELIPVPSFTHTISPSLTWVSRTPDTVALRLVGGMVLPVTVASRSVWVPLTVQCMKT